MPIIDPKQGTKTSTMNQPEYPRSWSRLTVTDRFGMISPKKTIVPKIPPGPPVVVRIMASMKSAVARATKKNSWNHQYSDLEARSLKFAKFRNTFSMESMNGMTCSGLGENWNSWNGLGAE